MTVSTCPARLSVGFTLQRPGNPTVLVGPFRDSTRPCPRKSVGRLSMFLFRSAFPSGESTRPRMVQPRRAKGIFGQGNPDFRISDWIGTHLADQILDLLSGRPEAYRGGLRAPPRHFGPSGLSREDPALSPRRGEVLCPRTRRRGGVAHAASTGLGPSDRLWRIPRLTPPRRLDFQQSPSLSDSAPGLPRPLDSGTHTPRGSMDTEPERTGRLP